MLLLAAHAAMSAQDIEQTAAPILYEGGDSHVWQNESQEDYSNFYVSVYNCVSIENADEAPATIYFRHIKNSGETEWQVYTGDPIYNPGMGESTLEVYAVADGKLQSDVVTMHLYYYDDFLYEAFLVDGIHYYHESRQWDWEYPSLNFEVMVCSRKESSLYSPSYSGELVIPSEILPRDHIDYFTVTEIRNRALAATFSNPCDITSVVLPSTIRSVGESAFAGCASLKRITVHAVTPPDAGDLFWEGYDHDSYGYYDYIGCSEAQLYEQIKLFVPNESLNDYVNHYEWGKFAHIVPFIGAGPGDINGDGSIGMDDLTAIINKLLSGEELPAYNDVNGDGATGMDDLTVLINMLLTND